MDYPEMLGQIIDTIYMTAIDYSLDTESCDLSENTYMLEIVGKVQKLCINDFKDRLFMNIIKLFYSDRIVSPDECRKLLDQIIQDYD